MPGSSLMTMISTDPKAFHLSGTARHAKEWQGFSCLAIAAKDCYQNQSSVLPKAKGLISWFVKDSAIIQLSLKDKLQPQHFKTESVEDLIHKVLAFLFLPHPADPESRSPFSIALCKRKANSIGYRSWPLTMHYGV